MFANVLVAKEWCAQWEPTKRETSFSWDVMVGFTWTWILKDYLAYRGMKNIVAY